MVMHRENKKVLLCKSIQFKNELKLVPMICLRLANAPVFLIKQRTNTFSISEGSAQHFFHFQKSKMFSTSKLVLQDTDK
jgi:hypothetical protein